MKLQDILNEYIYDCMLRGLSESTITNYKQKVKFFVEYFNKLDGEELREEHIKKYTMYLLDKNKENNLVTHTSKISRQSVRTYLNELRVFVKWSDSKGYTNNLYNYIRLPKRENKLVDIYSDDDIRKIFNALGTANSWVKLRNYVIISLFYDSGLRLDEVCRLEKDHFKLDKNVILVTGKGKKQRYVPLGTLTKKYYYAYLNKMPLFTGNKIFINRKFEPITGDAIQNVFYRIRKKTGVNVSAHKLRHNFATNYLLMQYEKNGHADIYQLMMILGHADVDTTRVYLHIAQQLHLGKETLSKLDTISNIMPSPL